MSGHSKWATIKRKKAAIDQKRGQVFTKLIKELTVAARMGGGDPNNNARLRKAIDDCKAQSMPAETLQRAIKRGAGELDGVTYEEVLYEGKGPAGTLYLVEATTDNRNRTVAEMRKIFERHGGVLGGAATAGWAFERKGIVSLEKGAATEDSLMEIAVGAGAEDYVDAGDEWQVTTPADALSVVLDALAKAHLKASGALAYVPKVKKPLAGRDAEVALNLAEALDEHDDVQNVYGDFEVSDEEMAKLAQ